ncbi:ester cyclase [Actinopolymorpha alba]|uniref:ester cyclase n=1 Tax=Actinopolymorpha alba TaxID=533267 RepID=UPI0012F66EE3|nr:ester cyclase [Actinopolymorpha alba]
MYSQLRPTGASLVTSDVCRLAATVALRAIWRGTHRGTGRSLRQRGLAFLRVENGRLAERWSAYSDLDS